MICTILQSSAITTYCPVQSSTTTCYCTDDTVGRYTADYIITTAIWKLFICSSREIVSSVVSGNADSTTSRCPTTEWTKVDQRRLDTVMWHTCVSEFMRSHYGGFCTEKTIRIFSVLSSITPKELVSFESASGVESEYPVNPVQPLGHFGCRAAWKSGVAQKPVKRSVTARETGCLCSITSYCTALHRAITCYCTALQYSTDHLWPCWLLWSTHAKGHNISN